MTYAPALWGTWRCSFNNYETLVTNFLLFLVCKQIKSVIDLRYLCLWKMKKTKGELVSILYYKQRRKCVTI